MKRREVGSIAVSLVCAIAFLALLAWLLDMTNQPAEAANEPSPGETDAVVMLEAPEVSPTESADSPTQLDPKPEGGATVDLSTESVGKLAAPQTTPPVETKTSDTKPSTTSQASTSKPNEPTTPQPDVTPLDGDSPSPPVASSESASAAAPVNSERGEGDAPQLSGKGKIPPIQNVGDVSALNRAYPRLEVAWVLDAPRQLEAPPPGVLVEAVLDKSGRLAVNNLRNNSQSSQYELLTMRYHCDELVRNPHPESMALWKHREAILASAGLAPSLGSLIDWGYYRHQAELFYLAKVAAAYQQASAEGRIHFDPKKRERIQITWRTEADGTPHVADAHFVSHDGSMVKLSLAP